MTRRHQTDNVRRINELRDQSFEDAYKVHDVGEALVRDRLYEFSLQAFQHGDDRRDEDVYSGTGVDLGVEHQSTTLGWIEIKTKQSHEWLGRLNKADWQEYRGFATYRDEPVFIYFAHVTDVDSARVETQYFVRVPPMDEDDTAVELPFTSKGHELVSVESRELRWPDVVDHFMDELSNSSTLESTS